jgi:hypothetical protein
MSVPSRTRIAKAEAYCKDINEGDSRVTTRGNAAAFAWFRDFDVCADVPLIRSEVRNTFVLSLDGKLWDSPSRSS